MATQHAIVPGQIFRSVAGQDVQSPKEFATLGNFTARTFGWPVRSRQPMIVSGAARLIVPPTGMTIPGKGQ
jgi:hypothetical protein